MKTCTNCGHPTPQTRSTLTNEFVPTICNCIVMTPTNEQKLHFIRSYFLSRIEEVNRATEGKWYLAGTWTILSERNSGDMITNLSELPERVDNATFIASARTDCPMAMEMVVQTIDWIITQGASYDILRQIATDIITRFEKDKGLITEKEVEGV